MVALLRASHIKPWALCISDSERLDVFNGILLAPHLDAIFDQGLATIADDGALLLSNLLSVDDRRILGVERQFRLSRIDDAHRRYLLFHREHVFRRS
jgi:predicted restriction endonuclease